MDATKIELTEKQQKELEVALTNKETAKVLVDKINELVDAVNSKQDKA